jgi:F-type H+-transporting ATPase subunit a
MASKIKTFKRNTSVSFLFFALLFLISPVYRASEPAEAVHLQTADTAKKKKVNMAEIAIEHVLDSHSWHLWGDEHPVSLPLLVILKTTSGFVSFSSGEFHHDIHGKVIVEKGGQRFVNFEEDIFYASETPNEHGQYLVMEVDAKGKMHPVNGKPLDFSITKNVAQLLFSALVLILLFTSIAKAYKSFLFVMRLQNQTLAAVNMKNMCLTCLLFSF